MFNVSVMVMHTIKKTTMMGDVGLFETHDEAREWVEECRRELMYFDVNYCYTLNGWISQDTASIQINEFDFHFCIEKKILNDTFTTGHFLV